MRQILILVMLLALLGACTPYDDNVADDDVLVIQTVYADQQVHHAGDSVKIYTVLQGTPPTGLTYAYQFTLSSGTIVADGSTATVTLAQAGRAVVKVTVTAPDGRVATRTIDLMGQNLSPVIQSWSVDRTVLPRGGTAQFEVKAFDNNLDTITYSYAISPNVGSVVVSDLSATYISEESGTFLITITVRDSLGGEASQSKLLTVEPSWIRCAKIYQSPIDLGMGPHFSACGDSLGRYYIVYSGRARRSDNDGTNWQVLGTANYFGRSPIQCDSNNKPYILHGASGGAVISVYSNNSWKTNSPLLPFVKNVYAQRFSMGVDNIPLVANLYSDDWTIEVSYLSNNVWSTLPVLTNDSLSKVLECYRLTDGSIWVQHYVGGQNLLKRWSGSIWQTQVLPGSGVFSLQLAGGALWVRQNDIFYRWNGSGWDNMFAGQGVLAVGADGSIHVYHMDDGNYWGFSIRNGVRQGVRRGDLPNAYIMGVPKGIYYYSIYASGSPSRPFLIYRDWHGNSFNIATIK